MISNSHPYASLTPSCRTRSLCRNIWISVGARGPSNKDPQSDGLSPLEHRRKERCLRLIVAFVVAVKRHVRGEYGVDHDDLRALLPVGFYSADDTPGFGTAAFAFTSESEESQKAPDEASVSIQVDEGLTPPGSKTAAATSTSPLMSPQMPPSPRLRRPWESQRQELDEHAPLLARLPSKRRSSRSSSDSDIDRIQRSPGGSRPKPPFLSKPSLPLPLVIAHQIHLYLADAKSKGYLESVGPAGYNALVQALATMTDNFSQIEKLSALPIPAIYGQQSSSALHSSGLTFASSPGIHMKQVRLFLTGKLSHRLSLRPRAVHQPLPVGAPADPARPRLDPDPDRDHCRLYFDRH